MDESRELDPLCIRPRLTIHQELHPELYERLSKVRPELINGLVLQLLIKSALMEKYWSLSVEQRTHITDTSSFTNQYTVEATERHASQPGLAPKKKRQHVSPVVATTPVTSEAVETVEAVDTSALKEALTGISF